MKKVIVYIVVIIVFITGFVWILNRAVNSPDVVAKKEVAEWISPDGVHYWCSISGYSWLAPRYDNNGNLVIDKQD